MYYKSTNNRGQSIELFHVDCIELMNSWVSECETCNVGMYDVIFVDPPFGINFRNNVGYYNRDNTNVIEYEDINPIEYNYFTREWINLVSFLLKDTGVLWVVSGWSNIDIIRSWARYYKLFLINEVIWHFPFGVFHKGKKFISSHYTLSLFVKNKKKYFFNSEAFFPFKKGKGNNKKNYEDRQDVWIIPREYVKGKKKTATVLPYKLIYKMLKYTSKSGDILLDPMMGSGRTLEVAYKLGLNVVGIEKNKKTFDFAYDNLKHLFN